MTSFDVRSSDRFYSTGDHHMPHVHRDKVDLLNNRLVGFHNIGPGDRNQAKKTVHFFMDDHKFERLCNQPDRYVDRLRAYRQVLLFAQDAGSRCIEIYEGTSILQEFLSIEQYYQEYDSMDKPIAEMSFDRKYMIL